MSLFFLDGFDHYASNAHLLQKWSACSGGTIAPSAGAARTGAQGLPLTALQWVSYNASAADQAPGFVIGMGFRLADAASGLVIDFASDSRSKIAIRVTVSGNGTVAASVFDGSSWTLLLSVTSPHVTVGAWHSVVAAVMHAEDWNGSVLVDVDGHNTIVLFGVATKRGGTKTNLDGFNIGPSAGAVDVDDVFAMNASSISFGNLMAPMAVATLAPSGAGDYAQLGFYGAATNWQAVASALPPSPALSQYVAGAAHGQKDAYTIGPALPTGKSIYGVALRWLAHKSDSAACLLMPSLKATGALPGTYPGIPQLLAGTAGYFFQLYAVNPATTAAPSGYGTWLPAEVNALQVEFTVCKPDASPLDAGAQIIYLPLSALVHTNNHAYSVRITARLAGDALARNGASACTNFRVRDYGAWGQAYLQQVAVEVLRHL